VQAKSYKTHEKRCLLTVSDLVVMVDNELKFGQQVDAVVLKTNCQLGLIKRSFTYLDEETLVLLYTSLVRPLLEYANVAWPVSFKKDTDKLERVQRRATCLLPHIRQLHYQDRLKMLNLPSLVYRRVRGDMIKVYKFVMVYILLTVIFW